MTDPTPDGRPDIGRRLGSGREADVYAWGDDAVVKLYRPGFAGHHAEAAALACLEGHHIAPSLVDVVVHDGRPGLVQERIVGADMLDLLLRRPWRVLVLAQALATVHLAVHEVQAPEDLPDVRQVLAARIEAAAPSGAKLSGELRDFALRVLGRLPSGDRLCHGDYHPGNVMVAADRVSAIDWPNAARGVPEADHARTLLLLRSADPVSDRPLVARWAMAAGRALLTRGYARAYAGGSRRPPRDLESWLVVHAAARVSEGIAAEQVGLVDLLARARHAGHLEPDR